MRLPTFRDLPYQHSDAIQYALKRPYRRTGGYFVTDVLV